MAGRMTPREANVIAKAQVVRLGDVLVIGPLMIYGASQMRGATRGQTVGRFLLAAAGVATIAFNGQNYLRIDSLRRGA